MVQVMLGAFWGGLYTPRWGVEMGRSAPISTFRCVGAMGLGFGYIININMGMSGRPLLRTSEQKSVFGTSEQSRARPTHHCMERCTDRSSTRSWLERGAATNMMHLRTKPGVIPSFLTVLRAEPRCRRPENRFIETRRNEADSYRKWEQGGP